MRPAARSHWLPCGCAMLNTHLLHRTCTYTGLQLAPLGGSGRTLGEPCQPLSSDSANPSPTAPAHTRGSSRRRSGGSPRLQAPASWAPRGRRCRCPAGQPVGSSGALGNRSAQAGFASSCRLGMSKLTCQKSCSKQPAVSCIASRPAPHTPLALAPPGQTPAAPRTCSCPRLPCLQQGWVRGASCGVAGVAVHERTRAPRSSAETEQVRQHDHSFEPAMAP